MKSPEKVSGKKQPKSWLPPKEKKEKVNKVENDNPGNNKYIAYCMQVVSYCMSEMFYLFTVCNLVQSNDQKKFYRERTLHSSMRMLHLLFNFSSQVTDRSFNSHVASLDGANMADLQEFL